MQFNKSIDLHHEAESTRGLGVLIQTHDHLLYLPRPREQLVNLLLRRVKRHVPHVDSGRVQQRLLILFLRPSKPPVPIRRQLVRILI